MAEGSDFRFQGVASREEPSDEQEEHTLRRPPCRPWSALRGTFTRAPAMSVPCQRQAHRRELPQPLVRWQMQRTGPCFCFRFQHRRYLKIGSSRRGFLGREPIVCRRLFLRPVLKQDLHHHPATVKSSGMERRHARGGLGREILPTIK